MQETLFQSDRSFLHATLKSVSSPVPSAIEAAMEAGAALAISVSGGKDSDAMARHTVRLYREWGWTGPLFAIFADLGRIEWAGVTEHLQRSCKTLGLPLVTVRRPQGGMVDRWQQRYEAIATSDGDKPFWSSAQSRYCTDHLKTRQINKQLRQVADKPFWSSAQSRYCTKELKTQQVDRDLRKHNLVVCAVGIRAQESPNRSKQPRWSVRSEITTKAFKEPSGLKSASEREAWAEFAVQEWLKGDRKGRLALTWHPIFDWEVDSVWGELGTDREDIAQRVALYRSGDFRGAFDGFPAHWAYATGNSRLSCSMCVLASRNDIENGARHNPLTWLELSLMEQESGWGFRQDLWLSSLERQVHQMSQRERLQLFRVLYELGLVRQWSAGFVLQLLAIAPPEKLMFWDSAILEHIRLYSGDLQDDTEPNGVEAFDQVFPDGSIQPWLF